MPELDRTDARILKILLEDGRRSLRQISRLAGVTAPTVQTRLRRMKDRGVIKKVAPVLDTSKLDQGIVAIFNLSVSPSRIEKIADELAEKEEVRGIYLATGPENLILRVVVDSLQHLQDFSEKLDSDLGLKQESTQMVLRVFKDKQAVLVRPGLGLNLQCATCNSPITGKPFLLKVAGQERLFCCRTCLDKFSEKYGKKLGNLMVPVEPPETGRESRLHPS